MNKNKQKFYITTPIYYVNDRPHLGGAYTTLAADTFARYYRKKLGRENVFFLTGTDENSQKTIDAAAKAGLDVDQYLQGMVKQWRQTWDSLGITYDDFIRTTEDRHHKVVKNLAQKIYDNGDIFKGKYEGLYCKGCEAFLKESDLDQDGNCPYHKAPPEVLSEDNYFFRLSEYQGRLLEFYDSHPDFLLPLSRRNEILSFIRSGLEDISISREKAEIGISLPWDANHKMYVWFDALINYYSALQEKSRENFWNSACHIIGKDITKFHCVIWPAMLMSAGIPLPQSIFAHGFFTIDGQKMSKTLRNTIYPLDISRKYGNDALRLGLLSAFEFGNDGDFSLSSFADFYRTRLAGGVGNLFNRVIVLLAKFLDGKKPKLEELEQPLAREQEKILADFSQAMEEKKLFVAAAVLFSVLDRANLLLNESQVWTLAKNDLDAAQEIFAKLVMYLESVTKISETLLPESVDKMKKMIGDSERVGKAEILFPQV